MSDNIDKQNRREFEQRRVTRRQEDVLNGLAVGKGPQAGDYKICRESAKVLQDYARFKNEGDRAKIKNEYEQVRKEYASRERQFS